MKTEIKKIVFDLDGTEICITPEQAKKLHELLNDMYGNKTQYYPIYVEPYHWWWNQPPVTRRHFEYITSSGSTMTIENDIIKFSV